MVCLCLDFSELLFDEQPQQIAPAPASAVFICSAMIYTLDADGKGSVQYIYFFSEERTSGFILRRWYHYKQQMVKKKELGTDRRLENAKTELRFLR
jgi:hypothetical protein